MTTRCRDGYGDPDHDSEGALGVDPPTPPSLPEVSAVPQNPEGESP
ncbi:hypothetical protein ACPPVT_02005 [Angustibacter sp. McL0619]